LEYSYNLRLPIFPKTLPLSNRFLSLLSLSPLFFIQLPTIQSSNYPNTYSHSQSFVGMSQLNQPPQIGQNVSPQGGRRMTIDERIQKHEDLGLDEDDSDDGDSKPEKRTGRRKIKIEFIEDKSRRHITFSKRKAGIMKKVITIRLLVQDSVQ
jgi:SRF-type transcription factor (DNA-binding and dimerisation domain)